MTQPAYQFIIRLMSAAEGGGYMIDYPDLRGCTARGATIEEAMSNGRDAQAAWIKDALNAGRFVPEAGAELATWDRLNAMLDAVYERAIPYKHAGTLICEGKPPPWLLHNLHMSGLLLVSCRSDEAKSPTASKMREHLQDMNRSAIALQKMLSDPEVLRLLGPQPYTFEYASAHKLMADLQQRSDFALTNLPSGRGKENVRRLFELLPRTLCALIIVESWKLFSSFKEPPKPTNARAHAAAEALWLASGGEPFGGHAKDVRSWRRHFILQDRARPSERATLKKILSTKPPNLS